MDGEQSDYSALIQNLYDSGQIDSQVKQQLLSTRPAAAAGPGAAIATGQASVAAAARAVVVPGHVGGSIFTGDIVLGGGASTGEALVQASLQQVARELVQSIMQPGFTQLFQVIQSPVELPAALFETHPMFAVQIPYQPNVRTGPTPPQVVIKATLPNPLLLQSRTGMGKSRELYELARASLSEGWTICVANLAQRYKMGVVLDRPTSRRLLVIVDNLHRHMGQSLGEQLSYLDGLQACLAPTLADPEVDLRLVATISHQYVIRVADTPVGDHPLWQRFSLYELTPFSESGLAALIQGAAAVAGIIVDEAELPALIRDSDGTPLTMVENVRLASIEQRSLAAAWQNTWRGTWQRSFREARAKAEQVVDIYEALFLLQSAAIPLRRDYVVNLAAIRTTQETMPALEMLVQRGVLALQDGLLDTFSRDHVPESLQSLERPLPDLAQEWTAVQATLLAVATSEQLPHLVSLSETLLEQEQFQAAVEVVTTALGQDPAYLPAYLQRGLAYWRLNQFQDMATDLSAVLAQEPDHLKALVLRGLAYLLSGRYPLAVQDLGAALAAGETRAYTARGLAYFLQRDFAAAVADFSASIEQSRADANAYRLRGYVYWLTDEPAAAVADFDELLRQEPEDNSSRFVRSQIHLNRGQFDAAAADFTALLEQSVQRGQSPLSYLLAMRGWLHLMQGHPADAETDLTQAIDLAQDDPLLDWLKKLVVLISDADAQLETASPDLASLSLLTLIEQMEGTDTRRSVAELTNSPFMQDWLSLTLEQVRAKYKTEWLAFWQQPQAGYHFLRAEARFAQDKFAQAEADFAAALQHGFSADIGLYRLALSRLAQNQYKEAAADLEQALAVGAKGPDPYYWLGSARIHLEAYSQAEAAFSQALALGMDDARVYESRARTRLLLQRLSEAEADLTAAINREPDAGDLYFKRGAVRHDMAQYGLATADFTQAVDRGYQETTVYRLRGWCQFRLGHFEKAQADFDEALFREPTHAEAVYGRAAARLNLGDFAGASADYTQAIAQGFTVAAVYVERGAARLELGDIAGAAADLAQAEANGAEGPALSRLQGWLYAAQGHHAQAVAALTVAIEAGQSDAAIYYRRGASYFHNQQYALAEADYNEAIKGGLASPEPLAERGWIRVRLGRLVEALQDLDQAIASGEAMPHFYYWRGYTHSQLQNFAAAVADYTTFIERGGDTADAYHVRGQAHAQFGDSLHAEADYSRSLAAGQSDPTIYSDRAAVRYDIGNYAGAAADATTLLEQQPDNAAAYQIRSLSYLRLGQVSQAVTDSVQAGHLAPTHPLTRRCQAGALLAVGDWEAAVRTFQGLTAQGGSPVEYLALGVALLLSGQDKASAAAFDQAVTTTPPEAAAFMHQELDFWLAFHQERAAADAIVRAAVAQVRARLAARGNETEGT